MATKGQVYDNKTTGETYEFLETAADTGGKQVSIKFSISKKGQLVPKHLHVLQDETFEVLSGKLTVLLNDKYHVLQPGEKMTLVKNIPHNHYNDHDEPVTFIQTVSPALDFEHLVETIIGLTEDGKMPRGRAGLMQELVTLKYLDSKTFLAGIPIGLQKIMMNTIGPFARMLGYRAVYKKYSGIEK